MKRLFIGIDLPEHATRELVALNPHLPGLRWLPASQLHLTLSFLGEVKAETETLLREKLAGVHVPAFFLPLSGVGSFSAGGRPSVVWVGVGRGHPHLFALHKHSQDAVIQAGLEPDMKPFHPHITVARAKGVSQEALRPLLRRHAESEFGLVHVTEFILFSSVLRADGAEHTRELQLPLRGESGATS